MLHLGDLLAHGHPRYQIGRTGIRIQPPVLIGVQRSVAVEIDKLIAVGFDDRLYFGIQRRLLQLRAFGQSSGYHGARHCKRRQQGGAAPEQIFSQQGSILLSHWMLS